MSQETEVLDPIMQAMLETTAVTVPQPSSLPAEQPPPLPSSPIPARAAERPLVVIDSERAEAEKLRALTKKAEADAAKARAEADREAAKASSRAQRGRPADTMLSKLAGSPERIIIRRRDGGHNTYIGAYDATAFSHYLANPGGMEAFVVDHIQPKWGPGIYSVSHVDKNGNETERPEVRIATPVAGAAASGMTPAEVLAIQEQAVAKHKELLASVRNGGGNEALIALFVEAQQQNNAQMMQFMQQQLAKMEERMAAPPPLPVLPPAPPDPTPEILKLLIEKMMSPAAASHGPSTEEKMLTVMREEREADRRYREQQLEIERQRREFELARADKVREMEMQEREKDRAMQLKLAEISAANEKAKRSPIEETVAAVTAMKQLEDTLAAGRGGTSLMDVLAGAVENLPGVIDKVMTAQKEARRQQGLAGMQGAGRQALPGQAPGQVPGQLPGQQRQQRQTPVAAVPPTPPKPEPLPFPPGFDDKMRAVTTATSDTDRVRALVEALVALAGQRRWQEEIFRLFNCVQHDQRAQAQRILESLMVIFVEQGKIERTAAEDAFAAAMDNWSAIVMGARIVMKDPDAEPAKHELAVAEAVIAEVPDEEDPDVEEDEEDDRNGREEDNEREDHAAG